MSTGVTTYASAIIDVCSQHTPGNTGDPHLRPSPRWPRDGADSPGLLWCLGHYDQQRQTRRVVVAVTDGVEELVGEGLSVVGWVHREPREPGACGECREPEDFDWHPTEVVNDGPVIVCFRHGDLAPGWAYEGSIDVGLLAYRNEPVMHEHSAKATGSHPAYKPSRFEEFCGCGKYRYRVSGGPWTDWAPWDEADGPNPALRDDNPEPRWRYTGGLAMRREDV